MAANFLSPKTVTVANEILVWAKSYLMAENPQIKRLVGNQTVCPFVGSSIEKNSFYMTFHPEVNGQDAQHIEQIMHESMVEFLKTGPFDESSKLKKALLVVFHNIPDRQTHALDIVHANLKDSFVQRGLMIGQFHKHCDKRGIYNPGFPVSISPHPLIAMRNMALHDILFVRNNPEWFKAYNIRFGQKFNEPEKIQDYNKHLIGLYDEAKRRWGA